MIIVQARIPVQSERRNVAYRHIHEFVGQTRSERGCIGCEAFVSLDDPDIIVIQQAWRGADDLDGHAAGPHLDSFLEALSSFVDGEVTTLRYDAVGSAAEADEAAEDAAPEEHAAPAGATLH